MIAAANSSDHSFIITGENACTGYSGGRQGEVVNWELWHIYSNCFYFLRETGRKVISCERGLQKWCEHPWQKKKLKSDTKNGVIKDSSRMKQKLSYTMGRHENR